MENNQWLLNQEVTEKDYGKVVPVAAVYPAQTPVIGVVVEPKYKGAHTYVFRETTGRGPKGNMYVTSEQKIQFVYGIDDENTVPGITSEQLILALLDRHIKLNTVYPTAQNEKFIVGLQMCLQAQKERIDERTERNVIGTLQA